MNKYVLLSIFIFLFLTAKAQDRVFGTDNDDINFSNVLFGLKVGFSTMPSYLDFYSYWSPDYFKKMNAGVQINASAHYMVRDYMGLGAEYSFFGTSANGTTPSETSTSSLYVMSTEHYKQYVNYLGPSVVFKEYLDSERRFFISENVSAGLALFRMEYQSTYPEVNQTGYAEVSTNALLYGNALSAKLGLTAEYALTHSLSVGLGFDYLWCLLKQAGTETKHSNSAYNSTSYGELANPLDLSRLDYSFVVHYSF